MATTKPAASRAKKPTPARKTTRRKPATKKPAVVEQTPAPVETLTEEQRQAKLEAWYVLKQAGLAIPEDLQVVETWVAEVQAAQNTASEHQEQAEQQRVAKANIEGPWYVRNCYNAPFNFRLDRQTERRRIELKQRGAPGDLHPLKDEDLRDPILIANVNIGLIEIIPAGEAQLIIERQTTNMGSRVHTPLAVIQKEYADHAARGMDVNPNPQLKLEAEYGAQGVTVAVTDPRIMQGQVPDRQIANARSFGGLQRVRPGEPTPQFTQPHPTIHSGFVPTGGNPAIISQGGMQADQARAKIQQDIAMRGKGQREAPLHPGPGELTVTVNPTQRT